MLGMSKPEIECELNYGLQIIKARATTHSVSPARPALSTLCRTSDKRFRLVPLPMAPQKRLWEPYALWPLPPSPYENHTPQAGAGEKLKWLLVGLTLLLPRILLAVVTSAPRGRVAVALQAVLQRSGPLTVLLSWLVALVSVAGWPRGAQLRVRLASRVGEPRLSCGR